MPEPGSFDHDRNSKHALQMNQWFLAQARGAIAEGVSALQADHSWTTFQVECPDLVERIAKQHPPPAKKASDAVLRARENHGHQLEHFTKWLTTAKGEFVLFHCLFLSSINLFPINFYFVPGCTKTFAKRIGLIESGLGRFCGNVKPGNDKEESDNDSDSPLAGDDEEAPTPKPDPVPDTGKTINERLKELTKEAIKWMLADEGSEMQTKTACLERIEVRGQPFKRANVLVVQGRVAGGSLLNKLDVEIDEDGGGGLAVLPLDPNVMSGAACIM